MSTRVRWAGERSFLVDLASLEEVMAFHARVVADPIGQVEQVAAARTVLLVFATAREARRAAARVGDIDRSPAARAAHRETTIDVVYDGDDLSEAAALTGMSAEAVIAAHTSGQWTAAFGGFAPGFAYLAGGDPRLRVPRREHPRTAVPGGSVAIAGEFSAVYPRSSPGGWRLLGRTDAVMWDLERDPPALISPGDAVRFRAVRALAVAARPASAPAARPPAAAELRVVSPGLLSLVQDRGRPGLADIGVTASGAADTASARRANRTVGNARGAAVIETLGGLIVAAESDAVIAIAGADPHAQIRRRASDADVPAALEAPVLLQAGDELALGMPDAGLRTYVAVRGGFDLAPAMGSRARDTLSGIGPDPLRAGDGLAVGRCAESAVGVPADAVGDEVGGDEPVTLQIRFGPRDDWFDESERAHLTRATWIAGERSDRIGTRLEPAPGERPLAVRPGDLASEGIVVGALQVPPSGEPVMFGPDHPVTGGYPVIAVVAAADLPRAAQLRPGTRIRFVAAP